MASLKGSLDLDVKCHQCHGELDSKFTVHKCFTIICRNCSEAVSNLCFNCGTNFDEENCITITAVPDCHFYSECKQSAAIKCDCFDGVLCKDHFHTIHRIKPAKNHCSPVVIQCDNEKQTLCDDCHEKYGEYLAMEEEKIICFICYMQLSNKENYILKKDRQLERFESLVKAKLQCAVSEFNDRHAELRRKISEIIDYNHAMIEDAKKSLEDFQRDLDLYLNVRKEELNQDIMSIELATLHSKRSGIGILRDCLQNSVENLDSIMEKVEKWTYFIDSTEVKVPIVDFFTSGDFNERSEFQLQMKFRHCIFDESIDKMVKDKLTEVVSMVSAQSDSLNTSADGSMTANTSADDSMTMNTSANDSIIMNTSADDSMTSETSIILNEQLLEPHPGSRPIPSKLTYFRCCLWFCVINPDKALYRATMIVKVNGDESKEYAKIVDARVGSYVIVKDKYKGSEMNKRAMVNKLKTSQVYVTFIDYGNSCYVNKSNVYEYPHDIENNDSTVFVLKLMKIAPLSNFIFLDKDRKKIEQFIYQHLAPTNNELMIERKWIAKDGIFANVKSKINDQWIDWAEKIIEAKLAKKCTSDIQCFIPDMNYCFNFHTNKNCHDNCFRVHTCPFCKQGHALVQCLEYKNTSIQ